MNKYYCKRCGELTTETDYLAEDYIMFKMMKKQQMCEKCLRELADSITR